jgi:hypothetical protein
MKGKNEDEKGPIWDIMPPSRSSLLLLFVPLEEGCRTL